MVLASGGYAFAASGDPNSLLRRHAPQACAYPTTNGPFAVGDGIRMAQEAGVSLVDMEQVSAQPLRDRCDRCDRRSRAGVAHVVLQVQVHPTAFVDPRDEGAQTKFLAPEALRAAGGILLSHEVRYAGAVRLRAIPTRACRAGEAIHGRAGRPRRACDRDAPRGGARAPCRGAERVPRPGPSGRQHVRRRRHSVLRLCEAAQARGRRFAASPQRDTPLASAAKGLVRMARSVDELAAAMPGASTETLRRTLVAYREAVEAGSDALARSALPATFDPEGVMCAWDRPRIGQPRSSTPLPARVRAADVAKVTPAVHYTMGGVRINAAGEALTESADGALQPVHGLFGAGEVTGGVHGGNRLAGNSLLECVVYGRRAGRRAAQNVMGGGGCGAVRPQSTRPARPPPPDAAVPAAVPRGVPGGQASGRTAGRSLACATPSVLFSGSCG